MRPSLLEPRASTAERMWSRRLEPAVAGVAAAGAALGASELLAGLLPRAPSLVLAVGGGVIDLAPLPVKTFAVAVFGTADKPALLLGIVALSALCGAAIGVAAARRRWLGAAGFAAFGALGALAGFGEPQTSPVMGVVVAALAAGLGGLVLHRLLTCVPTPADASRERARRRFLTLAVTAGVAGIAAAAGGRLLRRRVATLAQRAAVRLPRPSRPLPAIPASASLDVRGLPPFVTAQADFYRIDTALMPPLVDLRRWRLTLDGMVDRPFSLRYDDLLALGLVEADITLCCVSNEVGGELAGNARWQGVPLARLLDRAGVQRGADQVVGHAVDGWTAGFPTAVARDGRNALVAVAMNGEPLPIEHGFPARLVVPGLYGYVSATKWLARIQLTTWEDVDGYWVPRGWSKEGPVKTQSRIDVPVPGAVIPPGPTAVAGVAWAQHRGVSGVAVQIDSGPWQAARLSNELHVDTWRQWVLNWRARPGSHILRVRATDAEGRTQTAAIAPVAPNGATGHHTIRVTVS